MSRRICLLVMFGVGICTLSGCGGGVDVEGKVTKGGQPLQMGEGEGMNIMLTSDDGKSNGAGKVNQDGTFKITTNENSSMPTGKYKVSYVYYPAPPSDPKRPAPMPATVQTKEVWDVSSTNRTFTLDIPADKKKG